MNRPPTAARAPSAADITDHAAHHPPAVGAVLLRSASTIVVALNAQLFRGLDLRRPTPAAA